MKKVFFDILQALLHFITGAPQPVPPAEDASDVPADTVIVHPTPVRMEPVNLIESKQAEEKKQKGKILWILDNGHGRLQPGKRSPVFEYNGRQVQFFEYEFNRDIVERMMQMMDNLGLKYYDLVPDYDHVGSFLVERVQRANNIKSDLPKVYLSIHANAGPAPDGEWCEAHGVETWCHVNSQKGQQLAGIFQRYLVKRTGLRDRGIRSTAQRRLYVLEKTAMPAVLTENGFYNNKEEVLKLMDDEMRRIIAEAHVQAITEIEELWKV